MSVRSPESEEDQERHPEDAVAAIGLVTAFLPAPPIRPVTVPALSHGCLSFVPSDRPLEVGSDRSAQMTGTSSPSTRMLWED